MNDGLYEQEEQQRKLDEQRGHSEKHLFHCPKCKRIASVYFHKCEDHNDKDRAKK
jgi:hypothetical protein